MTDATFSGKSADTLRKMALISVSGEVMISRVTASWSVLYNPSKVCQ